MERVKEVFGGGVAVVTGAGSGVGRGIANYAAHLGMAVAVADIDRESAQQTADEINGYGGRAVAFKVDVRDASAMEALTNDVYQQLGDVTLLVNNAGIEQFGYLWDTPVENWKRLVDINITGIFNGVRAFMPKLIAVKKPAHIWNLSSMGGLGAAPRQSPYVMSRHASLGLTECLKLDVDAAGHDHIKVAVVLPGVVTSNIFHSAGGVESGNPSISEDERKAMLKVASYGITPLLAAERIFEQAANGDFYLMTQPEMISAAMAARAEQLKNRIAPVYHDVEFIPGTE